MAHLLRCLRVFVASCALAGAGASAAPLDTEPGVYGAELQGFEYHFPVQRYTFSSQRQALQMAYIDVAGIEANGRVVVLLHGKNFCAGTWESTINRLSQAGYRVIAPDQIGFCKSSKPAAYQFSFAQLAHNTHELLHALGIEHAIIMGHSTGGMLAIRYGLIYPEATDALVLVDPIGLEDWRAKGVPALSVDQWLGREQSVSAERIRAYERSTYYGGQWRPEFDTWVDMLAGMYRGPGREQVAWDSALLYDMILTQPVVYELNQLTMPTLLMIGDLDTTAIGKDAAPPEKRAALGHYPELGRAAATAIPKATLIEFAELGHAPQIQDPESFHRSLLPWLAAH